MSEIPGEGMWHRAQAPDDGRGSLSAGQVTPSAARDAVSARPAGSSMGGDFAPANPGDAPAAADSDQGGQGTLSVGQTLKSMRESRGLALGDVSARLKYSVAQLRHLEAGDWARLPEGVPLRGLVRNYARFLQTDVDLVLRLLDDAVGPTGPRPTVMDLSDRRALQQADLTPKGEPAHRTWAWLLLILLLFGAAGWYAVSRGWIPDGWLIFDWLKALRQ